MSIKGICLVGAVLRFTGYIEEVGSGRLVSWQSSILDLTLSDLVLLCPRFFFFPAPWNIFLLNIQRDLVCRYLWNILSVFVILFFFFPFLVFSDCVSQFCLHSPKFWCYVCVCPTEGTQQWCEQSQQSTVCTAFQAHTAADCFWAKLQWYLPVPSD